MKNRITEDYTKNLSTLHFHITCKCSYSCKHCSVEAGPYRSEGNLRLDDIERMVDQAKDLGTAYLDISGGDPLELERQFLLQTIRYSSRKGLSVSISTNAQNLNEEYAEALVAVGLQKIKFSLYGVKPETHDGFTGVPGSFERAINGIRVSREAGVEVWVNSVVTPGNLAEFQNLPSLLDPCGVDLVQLTSIVPCGRGTLASDYRFSEDGLERAIGMLEKSLSGLNYVFTVTLFPEPNNPPFNERYCDYFYDRLVVDHNGDVIPCCLLPENLKHCLGNIREGLSEVYSPRRIEEGSIFYWLGRGHEEMRRKLGYEKTSHNLCSICIDMLYRLSDLSNSG